MSTLARRHRLFSYSGAKGSFAPTRVVVVVCYGWLTSDTFSNLLHSGSNSHYWARLWDCEPDGKPASGNQSDQFSTAILS
jgi:hypothetical protein